VSLGCAGYQRNSAGERPSELKSHNIHLPAVFGSQAIVTSAMAFVIT